MTDEPSNPWFASCPVKQVLKQSADDTTLSRIIADIDWALDLLGDGNDAIVSTPWTGDDGASSKPITSKKAERGTRIIIRRNRVDTTILDLKPRRAKLTSMVEPGREPPAQKTIACLTALKIHLSASQNPFDDFPVYQERLHAIARYVSQSGRKLPWFVQMATPWSPLSAPTINGTPNLGRSMLLPSEIKAWSMPPMATAIISELGRRRSASIEPYSQEMTRLPPFDPIQNLRLINTLPKIRGR